jgi:hypothetical protein
MMELAINYGYVFILSKKNKISGQGKIAPTSSSDMKTHGISYRLYSLFYPVMKLISKLDLLLPEQSNGAVILLSSK